MTYRTFDQAIELANDCDYGLGANLYTKYRGPFLAGLDLHDGELFDERAVIWREQLHRQVLNTFFTLASYYERRGL
jgi:hypothetical protein